MEQSNDKKEELSNKVVSEDGNKLAELLRDISFAGYLETTVNEVRRDLIKRKYLAKTLNEHKDTFEAEAELFMNYYKTMMDKGFSHFEAFDMLWYLIIVNKGFNTKIGGKGLGEK